MDKANWLVMGERPWRLECYLEVGGRRHKYIIRNDQNEQCDQRLILESFCHKYIRKDPNMWLGLWKSHTEHHAKIDTACNPSPVIEVELMWYYDYVYKDHEKEFTGEIAMIPILKAKKDRYKWCKHHTTKYTIPNNKYWCRERLIWIASLKNNPKTCNLACLPKDMLRIVVSFIKT